MDLTIFEGVIRSFHEPSLLGIHERRLVGRDREKRGIKGSKIPFEVMCMSYIDLDIFSLRFCVSSRLGVCL